MSDRGDPTDRDPAPEAPLDETTPPIELMEKAAHEADSETPEDRGDEGGGSQ